MAKKTDEAERDGDFRIRPNRPHSGGKSEARAWSTALRTVLRYAGTSRRSKASANSGSGGASRRQFNQRCAVRTMYTANKTPGQWKAHGRYIARESAGGAALGRRHEPTERAEGSVPVEPAKELERWQSEGDPRLWKLIVSPEFGERLDLDRLTRDLMSRMEKDLGTKLEWVAVTHFNTEHPHVHIALRGIRDDKSALDLPRDYVRHGIRAIAEDLCTRQLGHRNHLDAVASERREIQERRFTSLGPGDQPGELGRSRRTRIQRSISSFGAPEKTPAGRESNTSMHGCSCCSRWVWRNRLAPQEWKVRRDFETVLKAMQRTSDRQKMLASHGALLSDERLPLVVLDLRKLKTLEGRVLGAR